MERKEGNNILIFRFSAIGDVAIAAPLVREYALKNPGHNFTMVSNPMLEPLFTGIPNLHFFPVWFRGKHRGLRGLLKLFKELKELKPDRVADLHSVLRTHILRFLFLMSFKPVYKLNKNRRLKNELTRRTGKNKTGEIPAVMYEYERVLVNLGLKDLSFAPAGIKIKVKNPLKESGAVRNIGIAPFAKHAGKEWPVGYMERVIENLSSTGKYKIALFGGGGYETVLTGEWEQRFPNVVSYAGKLTFKEELARMAELDLMLSMDSANMHFASFCGVPVISIWGATDPRLGFYGWRQDSSLAIGTDIECRPCSVFGAKKCFRRDYACLKAILPGTVIDCVNNFFERDEA